MSIAAARRVVRVMMDFRATRVPIASRIAAAAMAIAMSANVQATVIALASTVNARKAFAIFSSVNASYYHYARGFLARQVLLVFVQKPARRAHVAMAKRSIAANLLLPAKLAIAIRHLTRAPSLAGLHSMNPLAKKPPTLDHGTSMARGQNGISE